MSDQPQFDPASGSKVGGSRTAGQRSEKGQKARDAAIKIIKELWGVSEFVDIFPAKLKPEIDLGDSAISNLRQIAKKVPKLSEAKKLMLNECIDSAGNPMKISFKHTSNILAHLKEVGDKEEENKKKKDGYYNNAPSKKTNSSKSVASLEPLVEGKSTTTALSSKPASGSAHAKATAKVPNRAVGGSNPVVKQSHSAVAHSTPRASVRTVKTELSEKPSLLNRAKAPIPTDNPRPAAKSIRGKVLSEDLTEGKAKVKEIISGLHLTDFNDASPSEWEKIAKVKGSNPKMRGLLPSEAVNAPTKKPKTGKAVSFSGKEGETTAHVPIAEGDSGQVVTDDEGLSTGLKSFKINTPAKRPSTGDDESPLKKPKFDKESRLAELNFVNRNSHEEGNMTTGDTSSEAETEIGDETIGKLIVDKAAKKYVFTDEDYRKAIAKDEKSSSDVDASADEVMSDIFDEPAKKIIQAKQVLGDTRKDSMHHPSTGVAMAPGKQEVEKKGKISEVYLDSPMSPKNVVDREEMAEGSRLLAALAEQKRAKVAGRFSTDGEPRTNSTLRANNKVPSLSTNFDSKPFTIKKATMGYSHHDDSDEDRYARYRKKKEPEVVARPVLTRKQPANADDTSVPNHTLPKLPETLTARIPEDRALILSIPGIIRNYLEDLRASIPDGKAPNGDLLSMILVNKFGYFLEHVDKLDKDLVTLYYQAVDKDIELEKKELEKKELEKKELEKKELEKKELEKKALEKKALDKKALEKKALEKKAPVKKEHEENERVL